MLGLPVEKPEKNLFELDYVGINATHFTGRSHIHSQYRVGFLEAVERELARLDPDIIEFEQILLRLLNRQAEHDFRGKFDKIDLQYLAEEGI